VFEAHTGMPSPNIFHAWRRRVPQTGIRILKATEYPENAVVSTGGGLPCFFDNMDWMNAHGQSVYMKLTPKAGLAFREC
jgi:shikimate kinase